MKTKIIDLWRGYVSRSKNDLDAAYHVLGWRLSLISVITEWILWKELHCIDRFGGEQGFRGKQYAASSKFGMSDIRDGNEKDKIKP